MLGRKEPRSMAENVALGVFAAVICAGIVYVLFRLTAGDRMPEGSAGVNGVPEEPLVAPTPEEYDDAAREVMSPFLAQAALVTEATFEGEVSALLDLVEKTEERMIRLRVPAERQEAHLDAVLLLAQWKRALAGSAGDQKTIVAVTAEFSAEAPWSAR